MQSFSGVFMPASGFRRGKVTCFEVRAFGSTTKPELLDWITQSPDAATATMFSHMLRPKQLQSSTKLLRSEV